MNNLSDSQPAGHRRGQHAQEQGAGDRDKPFPPKQPEAEIARQTAKTQFLKPRLQATEDDQRQEHHNQPTQHTVPSKTFTGGASGRHGQSLGRTHQRRWKNRSL